MSKNSIFYLSLALLAQAQWARADQSFSGQDLDVAVEPGADQIVNVTYQTHCTGSFPGIPASAVIDGRTVRFDLLEGKAATEFFIGAPSESKITIHLSSSDHCDLSGVQATAVKQQYVTTDMASLALKHSPFLVVRDDQFSNRWTDLPIVIAYSIMPAEHGSTSIRYTLFMTDEDSETTAPETDDHMSRYGRRTDIEWLYEITFSPTGEVVQRKYQGDIFAGAGHSTRDFHGAFLPGTDHPVLYNIANHNVFADSPDSGQRGKSEGYHLVPRDRIDSPDAREIEMFRNPWTFRISDLEMARENKISWTSDEWLYLRVLGNLKSGSFVARITLDSGENFESGGGRSDIDRLGEDLWNGEAYTAIPLRADRLRELAVGSLHGKVRFISKGWFGTDLSLQSLRFYSLSPTDATFTVNDETSRFHCPDVQHSNPFELECSF